MKAKIYIFGVCALLLIIGVYSVRHNSTNTAIAAESQTTTPNGTESLYESDILFTDYESWPHSFVPKTNDTTKYFMDGIFLINGGNSYNTSYPNDMNGDGLTDLIYGKQISVNGGSYSITAQGYAMFANKGSFDFEVVYKCLTFYDSSTQHNIWYGDCAQQ